MSNITFINHFEFDDHISKLIFDNHAHCKIVKRTLINNFDD